MSPAELALLLTLGRITRRLLQSQARSQSGVQWIADLFELNEAMAHFEPSTADLEDISTYPPGPL
jgi:hypothetical protein